MMCNTLTMDSFLVCKHGGIIMPINSGQDREVGIDEFQEGWDAYRRVMGAEENKETQPYIHEVSDFSGCEIIAAYNAKVALGEKMTETEMAELICTFEKKGAVLSGEFGVAPTEINDYFEREGYETEMITSMEKEDIVA